MARPTYDTAAEIPAGFEEEYEEHEGKWRPKAAPDVTVLMRSLEAERKEKEIAEKARKAAEKKAVELERANAARDSGVSEEALKKIRDDEEAARRPIEQERDAAVAENRKLKLTDKVRALWIKYGGMATREEDAMDALAKCTDLGDAGGIVVKNIDGTLSAESIDDFLRVTFKKRKPWLYVGTGGSGSGAPSSESGDGVPAAIDQADAARHQQRVAGAF